MIISQGLVLPLWWSKTCKSVWNKTEKCVPKMNVQEETEKGLCFSNIKVQHRHESVKCISKKGHLRLKLTPPRTSGLTIPNNDVMDEIIVVRGFWLVNTRHFSRPHLSLIGTNHSLSWVAFSLIDKKWFHSWRQFLELRSLPLWRRFCWCPISWRIVLSLCD